MLRLLVKLKSLLNFARFGINRELVKIYVACFIVFPSNSYSVAMLYPFLSAMTKFFLPDIETALVNRYAGIIVGAFFAGRIFGSYIWGSLADHFGRRPVLIASAVLMTMSTLVLAFSVSYTMTVAFRVVLGFCSGVFVVTRAVISESSSNRNQTFGFSVLTCSWLLSAMVAPLLSGLSADPITQYNLTLSDGTLKSFLTNFPYAPPFLLNTVVCIAGVFAVIFLLPETLDKVKKKRLKLSSDAVSIDLRHGAEFSTSDITVVSLKLTKASNEHDNTCIAAVTDCEIMHNEQLNSLQSPNINGDQEKTMQVSFEGSNSFVLAGEINSKPELEMEQFLGNVKKQPTDFGSEKRAGKFKHVVHGAHSGAKRWFADVKSILFNKVTLLVFLAHCLFAVVDTGFDSLYSLWCATPLYLGGIGFSVRDIGLTSTVVGALFLPFSLFTYPLLEKKFGSIQSFQMSAILNLFLAVSLPNIHYLAVYGPTSVLWLVIIVTRLMFVIGARICFAAQCIFIGNSVTHEKLGRANGLAVLMSDVFRAISPALSGTIYAASLSQQSVSIGFPVDYNFMFLLFGGLLLTMVLLTACLPNSINHKKVDDGVK